MRRGKSSFIKKESATKSATKSASWIEKEQKVRKYLRTHDIITRQDTEELLEVKKTYARKFLSKMVSTGILVVEGTTRDRRYRLGMKK